MPRRSRRRPRARLLRRLRRRRRRRRHDHGRRARRAAASRSANGSDFNAQAVYDRAAPGVVTVFSVFDNGGGANLRTSSTRGRRAAARRRAAGGPGLRLRHLRGGRDRHQRARRHGRARTRRRPDRPINQASEVFVQFPDRNSVEAEVIGFDPFARRRADQGRPRGPRPPARRARATSRTSSVGEQVAAIGSPFGERQSLSVGFVSALGPLDPVADELLRSTARSRPTPRSTPATPAARCWTPQANVIGINQQIDTTSGGNQGVGFAVPVDLFERSVEQLREDGEVEYALHRRRHQAALPAARRGARGRTPTRARSSRRYRTTARLSEAGIEPGDQEIDFQVFQNLRRRAATSSSPWTARRSPTEADLPRIVSRMEPGRGGQARNHPGRRGNGGRRHARTAPGHPAAAGRGLGLTSAGLWPTGGP